MAKSCIYCGKELTSDQRCDCSASVRSANINSGNASSSQRSDGVSSNSKDSKEQARRAKEYAREQARRSKDRAREQEQAEKDRKRSESKNSGQNNYSNTGRQTGGYSSRQGNFGGKASGFKSFLLQVMTSRGFSVSDSFPKKLLISFLQAIFRPVTASEAFVRNRDMGINVFYMVLFSASFSLAVMSLREFGYVAFAEGILFGVGAYMLLNLLFMLLFRLLLKAKYTFAQITSSFDTPAIYMTIFMTLASIGRFSIVSFTMTLITGLIAMVLLHFVSLKAMTGQSTERLLVNTILSYFLYFTIFGFIVGLIGVV